jgi:hypothetical protein
VNEVEKMMQQSKLWLICRSSFANLKGDHATEKDVGSEDAE